MAISPSIARSSRRLALLLVVVVTVAGCETYPVTREPDPPIGGFGRLTIALAIVLGGAVWVGLGLVVAVGRRQPSVARLVLGGAWIVATTFAVGFIVWTIALDARVQSILGDGGCRALAPAERPRQLFQLTCTEGGLDDNGLLVALVVVPGVLLGVACAVMVLRGDSRPWLPTLLSGAAVVGLISSIAGSGGEWTTAGGVVWFAGFACALIATGAGAQILSAEAPIPTPPPPAGAPIPPEATAGRAAAFGDRLQAVAIDGLLLLLPLVLLADNTSGPTEGAVCVGLVAAYLVGTTLTTGQTIGKRILGLRVVGVASDVPPDLPTTLTRVVALFLVPTTLLLTQSTAGMLYPLWAVAVAAPMAWPARRGLHDLLAGTKVIRTG